MKAINYYVIGGQYESYCYGGAATLLGAKRLAGKHVEHWDNWQGAYRPRIYAAKDCIKTKNFYGWQMVPGENAYPVAQYDSKTHRWIDADEYFRVYP